MRVAPGDAVALAQALVRVDSRNPSLVPGAPGEAAAAELLAGVLREWGFDAALHDTGGGRPNVVARAGRPGGRSLMFNGHLDVVGTEGMTHPPFDAEVVDGVMHGRGAADMKAGVAAMCAAAWRAARAGLAGEVVIAAVADEEFESRGTRALVAAGVRADAAIVTEPSSLAIMPAHRGFVWLEFTFRGRAAHGSRYEIGIDAIRHAAAVLMELDHVDRVVLPARAAHPLLGRASLHAGTIAGGTGLSTYPDACTLGVERRTLPGESADAVLREARDAVARATAAHPGLDVDVRMLLAQEPSDVPTDAPIVRALADALRLEGEPVRVEGMTAWTDAALLNAAGIPAICFGPGDIAVAHAVTEFVPVHEIERATAVLTRLALAWTSAGDLERE